MIGAGSAALRRVMTNPLKKQKPLQDRATAAHDALSGDSINAIIEGEIIPRLLLAHAAGAAPDGSQISVEIAPSDANRFASLPLQLEAANLLEEVDTFIEQGVSVEAIYLDLLAPAARRLGEMWESDECDFIDVTMGLWRLQEVMREISGRVPIAPRTSDDDAPRALFAPIPGDDHNFGAQMLDEVFSRQGWSSTFLSKPERRELLDALSRQPFDVVGLTLSRDCPSSAISNLINAMRSVSANPHMSIIIGGHMINQNPAIVAEVGADGTGADARAALDVAERLVQSAPVHARNLL